MLAVSQMAQLLQAEHAQTLEVLNRLDRVTAKGAKSLALDPAHADAHVLLQDVARVCTNDAGRHFGFEEDRLFPVILERGGACMVQILTAEHAQIRPLADQLRELAAAALSEGTFSAGAWQSFVLAARDMIDIETFHIQKEEMGLVGALQTMFTAEEDAALAADYAASRGG